MNLFFLSLHAIVEIYQIRTNNWIKSINSNKINKLCYIADFIEILENFLLISSSMVSTLLTSRSFFILFYNKVFINLLYNLDFWFFYNKDFINFLINLYIFQEKYFFQHAIHLLIVEHMALQNNSSVNFLANNNLISYMTKVHHNPKDKIWWVASFLSLVVNGFCRYHLDSNRLYLFPLM